MQEGEGPVFRLGICLVFSFIFFLILDNLGKTLNTFNHTQRPDVLTV